MIGPGFFEPFAGATADDLPSNIEAMRRFVRGCVARPLPADLYEEALCWNMVVPAKVRAALVQREIHSDDVLKTLTVPVLVTHGRDLGSAAQEEEEGAREREDDDRRRSVPRQTSPGARYPTHRPTSRVDGALVCARALTAAALDRNESGEQREMNNNAVTNTWCEWQQAVVELIREDFSEVLTEVGEEDVDWDAWRPLYDRGLSPGQAVAEAFLLPAA